MIKTELVTTVYDPIGCKEYNICELPRIELTDDDIGLILDALYEQANEQGYVYHNFKYVKALRKVAKKFEKCLNEKEK